MARFIELNRPFVHKHNYRMTAEREEKKGREGSTRSSLRDDRTRIDLWHVDFMIDREIYES